MFCLTSAFFCGTGKDAIDCRRRNEKLLLPGGRTVLSNLDILRVEVRSRQGNSAHNGWIRMIHQMGLVSIESCANARLFFVASDLDGDQVQALARRLLADNVTEEFTIVPVDGARSLPPDRHTIEVTLLP